MHYSEVLLHFAAARFCLGMVHGSTGPRVYNPQLVLQENPQSVCARIAEFLNLVAFGATSVVSEY